MVPTFGLSATFHDRAWLGSPEFRIEGLFARRPAQLVTGGNGPLYARLVWVASRLTACPLQLQLTSITVGPCAMLELGALHGVGRSSTGTGSNTGWWVAPGVLLNWSVQTEPVWLRLAAGAVRPLVRDSFQFSPTPEVFRPPSFAGTAEFELGWAFW